MSAVRESVITCDTASCDWRIRVTQDLTDRDATIIVEYLGGGVTRGSARDYHHCPKHRTR